MKTVVRTVLVSLTVFPFIVSASDSGPRYSLDRDQKLQSMKSKGSGLNGAKDIGETNAVNSAQRSSGQSEAILQIDSSLNSSINPTRTNSSSAADLKAPEQGPEQKLDESRSRAMTKSRL